MTRVLITGGSGLLATNWAQFAKTDFEVVLGIHNSVISIAGVETASLNLESLIELNEQIKAISPDIVIHAAGLTNVDGCERDPKAAHHVNTELARNVAEITSRLDIKLVHISTDHLFSGQASYAKETDMPHPVNVYAQSKLNAEHEVLKFNKNALIIRTNFFGWGYGARQSFSDWILDALRDNKMIQLFDDVFFTPIHTTRLAELTHGLIHKNASGIFNVVSDDRLSKYEFGLRLASEFGYSRDLISPSQLFSKQLLAARPYDMSLSNSKLKELLDIDRISIKEQFKLLNQQFADGSASEIKNLTRES